MRESCNRGLRLPPVPTFAVFHLGVDLRDCSLSQALVARLTLYSRTSIRRLTVWLAFLSHALAPWASLSVPLVD